MTLYDDNICLRLDYCVSLVIMRTLLLVLVQLVLVLLLT